MLDRNMANSEYNTFLLMERSLRWLRGLSEKQIDGCNNLLHALRDDIEQESTYRVHECLSILGLTPMPTSKQIKSIMALSQDNDLAFLWFIWEAFYKTSYGCNSDNSRYSVNEQLILSSIAHLDMMTTMRALDQILPTSEHSKKHQEKQRAEKLRKAELRKKLREERRPMPPFNIELTVPYHQRAKQLKEARRLGKNREITGVPEEKVLPYLMPQLRPKLYEPMSMTCTPSNRKVVFPTYESYKDKHFRIPNERSRWFSTYELSPMKREIKRCLTEALAPIFGGNRMPLKKSVCNMHRMLEFAASRKEHELTGQTLERSMKLLMRQREKSRRKHIIRKLEEDVEKVALELQHDARRQLMQLQQLLGGACNIGQGCEMCRKLVTTPPFKDKREKRADFSFLMDFNFKLNHPLPDDLEKDEPVKVYELGLKRVMKFIKVDDDQSLRNTLGSKAYCSNRGKKQQNAPPCLPNEGVIKVLNDQGQVVKRIKPSDLFCPPRQTSDTSLDKFCSRKTMKNGILQWDYFKIYQQPTLSQSTSVEQFRDTGPIIRSYCIEALNRAMRESSEEAREPPRPNSKEPLNVLRSIQSDSALEAAEKSAIEQFSEAVKSKSLTVDNEGRTTTEEKKKNICEMVSAEKFKAMGSIDPDDLTMLMKLLKIAVDIMQHDPQYVLVTLPNVHMMPVLLDWVAERYGKTYNHHQMKNMAKNMGIVYERLNRSASISQPVPMPSNKYFRGSKCIETYDNYPEYACKVGQSQDDYYRRLNQMALEESRIIWLAMHGYSNLGGSITDTFFAYLPAKELDFVRHRPWNSRDFRDMAPYRRKQRANYTFR